MIQIVLTDYPYTIYSTTLDSKIYNIETLWNGREQAWYMSFYTQGGTPLVRGIKILPYINLLASYAGEPSMPSGGLVIINRNGSGDRPTRTDLGTEAELYYLTDDELADAGIP